MTDTQLNNAWGIVATIKAPAADILSFVAYHLDLGADHIYIFLDDANPVAQQELQSHPKVTVTHTDDAYWQSTNGRRPHKHQVRQVHNASRAYSQATTLDWLAHIDVDEFLCASDNVASLLAHIPSSISIARVAPCESLCPEDQPNIDRALTYCKAKPPNGPKGQKIEHALYPQFGGFFKAGFISHTAGKIFVRLGQPKLRFAIHRAFANNDQPLPEANIPQIELCHRHVESWEKWLKIMTFRLSKGSYRAELEQSIDPASGRISRHQMFSTLTQDGTDALREFFNETCLATPKLRVGLEKFGLLRCYKLDLAAKTAKHFSGFTC
ncbi:MAG: glycosyltransferase family 2 protein [Cognatishimia sp.]